MKRENRAENSQRVKKTFFFLFKQHGQDISKLTSYEEVAAETHRLRRDGGPRSRLLAGVGLGSGIVFTGLAKKKESGSSVSREREVVQADGGGGWSWPRSEMGRRDTEMGSV